MFFRASASREASARGLAGWIRNRPDGSVEAVLQGAKDAVDEVVEWCRTGPPMARVDRVDVQWEHPDPAAKAFTEAW